MHVQGPFWRSLSIIERVTIYISLHTKDTRITTVWLTLAVLRGNCFSQFSSVQSLSCVQLFATPWTAACQVSLSITNSRNLLKFTSIESVMPSNHLILCHPQPQVISTELLGDKLHRTSLKLLNKNWLGIFSITVVGADNRAKGTRTDSQGKSTKSKVVNIFSITISTTDNCNSYTANPVLKWSQARVAISLFQTTWIHWILLIHYCIISNKFYSLIP